MQGNDRSMLAHCGADSVQMLDCGLTAPGSSSEPTRTNTRCGRASAALNRWVPQRGQKRRCMTLPLSA